MGGYHSVNYCFPCCNKGVLSLHAVLVYGFHLSLNIYFCTGSTHRGVYTWYLVGSYCYLSFGMGVYVSS